jgi:hypothetical protein
MDTQNHQSNVVDTNHEAKSWTGKPIPGKVLGLGFADHFGVQNQWNTGSPEKQNKGPRLFESGAGAKSYHVGE